VLQFSGENERGGVREDEKESVEMLYLLRLPLLARVDLAGERIVVSLKAVDQSVEMLVSPVRQPRGDDGVDVLEEGFGVLNPWRVLQPDDDMEMNGAAHLEFVAPQEVADLAAKWRGRGLPELDNGADSADEMLNNHDGRGVEQRCSLLVRQGVDVFLGLEASWVDGAVHVQPLEVVGTQRDEEGRRPQRCDHGLPLLPRLSPVGRHPTKAAADDLVVVSHDVRRGSFMVWRVHVVEEASGRRVGS